jgi:hypothetical protein
MKPLGIIQTAGLGDIVIALPIARYYFEKGREIFWPIREDFLPSFSRSVPWVRWMGVPTDPQDRHFYEEPVSRLQALGCSDWVCLYQALGGHPELSDVPWFQLQKFDEFKYTRAGVPFSRKWTLGENCITRFPERERNLARAVNPEGQPYVLLHLMGSTFATRVDLGFLPPDLLRIEITEQTDSVFDWLALMEGARALVLIDSVFANLADQLLMAVDKYWVPRSPVFLTPVLGSRWTVLPPPADSLAARIVFPRPT